jgi:hypothetical protein
VSTNIHTRAGGTFTPQRIGLQPDIISDTALQERWSHDICEEQGKARLGELVGHIKVMVNEYHTSCYSFYLSLKLLDSVNADYQQGLSDFID